MLCISILPIHYFISTLYQQVYSMCCNKAMADYTEGKRRKIHPGALTAEREALESYGRNLGIAFQLVDDALDYSGKQAQLGKSVGDDFREGKITLPVVLSYRRGDDIEREFWKRVMEQGEQHDGDQ